MRLRPVAPVLVGLLAALVSGCSPTSAPEPTEGTLGESDAEATLLTVVTTVPDDDDLPEAVAARLASSVPDVLGVIFDREQLACVTDGIVAEVDDDALREVGLGGVLAEQALDVQAAVFAVLDRCVDPTGYARIGAPILVNAGAQQPVAECVFRELRERLGFSGLYFFAYANAGGAPADPALGTQVAASYDACDLDPETLSVPTGPPTSPGTPTSVTTTSSSTVPGAIVETVPSTTVVPPVQPPDDPVVSTTRPRPTTTVAAVTTSRAATAASATTTTVPATSGA